MSVMSDATRIRMVARSAIVELDVLVDDGLWGPGVDALIDHAEALAIAPFARGVRDPFRHLCELRDVLATVAGRTAQSLVDTLDELIARSVAA
ncbi:hypothetical protein LQ327_11995 [Actinomycetospora endophytica]|uniref:Excreted virulence factor EspC (Type VII ESX diderm) n=1 Tax=Actinomycetospora endophytica TaxID=2291215 RepID=A0ABS8P9M0_9PSEU|nr:hypothetical protein [Actinomycetospora endophytica]MCD2194096.1 hypothetical protein [Actinomycetospora endophytica]